MTFVIVCGGTAGHINPGLAIAEELRGRLPESKILFIGADRDLEKRLVPEAGFELKNITMSGIKRGFKPSDALHNIKTAYRLISAGVQAAEILKETQPRAVIGTGGYVCYPVLKAAAKRKIPTFIHESNAKPGMTVKMLSGVVDKVMITYEGFDKHYKRPDRLVMTGTPVRKGFALSAAPPAAPSAEKPLVVSFWGSLGAERMNDIMAGFIKRNVLGEIFHHIHATGGKKCRLEGKLEELGVTETSPPYADIRDYIGDMPNVMKKADLVLCRAGGATLAELTAIGKPSILIPSPFVPDNVQEENAKQLSKREAAMLINEQDCNGDMLYEAAAELVTDCERLKAMSDAAKTLARPEAASDIVNLIMGTRD